MTTDALLTSAAASTALPVPRSPLFGRTEEVAALLELLGNGARLVTVTGAGGIGKTRVALEAARQTVRPVEFIALAGVEPDGLLANLVGALTPEAPPERSAVRSISDRLAGTATVVVLDTFEHLLPVARHLGELLDACPDLSLLVTSRSRLRLDGERVLVLKALPGGADGAAVAMFAERAHAVGVDGVADDPALAVEVCELLDGVPLAIELAAARTPMLSPRGLVSRLTPVENRQLLSVLARGQADVVGRHQSMRAAIEWSYLLLDPAAQLVFRRCGAFNGAFSLEAAQEVGACEVLDALAALVDLHLLEPSDDAHDTIRFRMLDPLREYARELLDAQREYETVRDRLVRWGVLFGREAAAGLSSGAEGRWLERVEADLPNLNAVFGVLVETDVEASCALACQLAPFWIHRGPLSEGRRWLTTALRAQHPEQKLGTQSRAVAVAWAARMALEEGDLQTVGQINEARLVIAGARARADSPDAVNDWLQATEHLAYGLTLCNQLPRADDLTAEAIEVARESGRTYWLAVFLQRRALSAQRRNEPQLARSYAVEAIAAATAIGYDRIVARAEQILAQLQAAEAPAAGYEALLVNLEAHRAAGDRRGVVSAMAGLGAGSSETSTSARWFREGLDEAQRIGYWHGEAICVMGLAAVAAGSGRLLDAALLDGGLKPHMAVLKANLPPHYFSAYSRTMNWLAGQLGDAFDQAERSAPMHWPKLRERARAVANELCVTPDTPASKPAVRRRGARHNPKLTTRELEILAAIAEGRTNPQIAAALYLSPKTVMHHSSSIYRKLGVRGRAEAVAHAYHTGMLSNGLTAD